jgi:signal transduction histidine kinase/CheY-like chemotaxis protein
VTVEEVSFDALREVSREVHVSCDRDGTIRFADDRAGRILGAVAGGSLHALVAPGCEAKLEDFLRRAVLEEVQDCEVPVVAHGKPLTLSLSSVPHAGGLIAIGHVLPAAFAAALDQVTEMIAEVADLNRTITTQRNQIAARNAELLRVNTELLRINAELSESNQGILALHRELQEKSDQTREENEIKTRLVANLSHELRTPLHSILGLTQLLSSGLDGCLAPEQEKQVRFIRASAEELLALINDVLDLSRLDAGHAQVRLDRFSLGELVASLRGVLRPLVPVGAPFELVIEDPPGPVELETDQTKLSQIIRNLVSNAIKFTERGEVRVRFAAHDERLEIEVSDTGIGIAEGDLEKIFEEYGQIESHLQRRLKGTGLGLPLSKRLVERLGGTLRVTSRVGDGSTFTVDLPLRHDEAREMQELLDRSRRKPPDAASILVVEDDRQTLFLYEKYLVLAGFHVMPARSVEDALALMRAHRPAAIVLDVMLEGDSSWGFLAQLKSDPATHDIPVLVVTVTNREAKARALGADEFWLKPVDQQRLLRKLKELARQTPLVRVLVIDDDETARYIIRKHLENSPHIVFEAATGDQGIAIARAEHPHVILLDFLLEGCTAFDVIDDLKADPRTRTIPIIVITSHVLDAIDQRRLLEEAEAVISKQNLSRELAINRIRDALRKVGRQ